MRVLSSSIGVLSLAAIAIAISCTSKKNRPSAESAAGTVASMPGAACSAMMDAARTQTYRMTGMTGSQMAAIMPMHRQAVTNVLAQMTSHMQQMGVSPSPAFSALADSIRADLDQMSAMSPAALVRAMPAHDARLSRLEQSHMASCAQHMGTSP